MFSLAQAEQMKGGRGSGVGEVVDVPAYLPQTDRVNKGQRLVKSV